MQKKLVGLILLGGSISLLASMNMRAAEAGSVDLDSDLREAVLVKDLKRVKKLIKDGADVDAADNLGLTPLIYSASEGSLEIVEGLIQAGAHVDLTDDFGYTPLMDAASEGFLEIVEKLIQAGADVTLTNNFSYTPLKLANRYKKSEIVETLQKARANSNGQSGLTPLDPTISHEDSEIVNLIVDSNAEGR